MSDMQISFVGMLLGVEQRTSKQSQFKYTVFRFSSVDGHEFNLSGEGHMPAPEGTSRKDLNWTVNVVPSTYNGVTKFSIVSMKSTPVKS